MKKRRFLLLAGVISLLAAGCRPQRGAGMYDVVVVGGTLASVLDGLGPGTTGPGGALPHYTQNYLSSPTQPEIQPSVAVLAQSGR